MANITGNYTEMEAMFNQLSDIHLIQGNVLNSVLIFFLIILASYILAVIVHFILEKIIAQFTKKTKTKIDDLIVEKTKKPFYFLIIFFGVKIALYPLIVPEAIENLLKEINQSLIIITVFLIIGKIINIIIEEWGKNFAKKTKSSMDDQLLSLFHKFINFVVFVFAIIFVLKQWGIEVTPFLASLGIAGIAIAFALQSTLSNVLGGIQLIIDQSIQAGDVVKVGTDIFGTVEDIGIRSTRIKTPDNEFLIVPNGMLANMTIQNFAQPEPSVRVTVDFGVAYGSDPKNVKKIIEEAIRKDIKMALKKPEPEVIFVAMADFALTFQARFWVDSYTKRLEAKVEATNLIYYKLQEHKIDIPFPTRTVIMRKE